MAVVTAQVNGSETFVRETVLGGRELVTQDILPTDAEVLGWSEDRQGVIVHARHPLGTICIETYGRGATITVAAATAERLNSLHDVVTGRVPEPTDGEGVPMTIWGAGDRASSRRQRNISAPLWSAIRSNYPTTVRQHLDALMTLRRPDRGGRLIVWYGAPGTGKTNAIRALARAWHDWCETHVLADPEAFLSVSSKIDEVLASNPTVRQMPTIGSPAVGADIWRLVIAEDTDDLLHATNAGHGGGALGRLFNLADGIIGQGTNTIFLITTNARVTDLHPALLRAGRCLSRIEFEPHSASEARDWLPPELRAAVTGPLTLAEMYELRGDHHRIEHHRTEPQRGYL